MGLMQTIRDKLLNWLMPEEWMDTSLRERLENYSLYSQYYQGNYRKQLKVKPLQADDNLGLNFAGLVIDRSISMLLGNGIGFDFGENEDAGEYIKKLYIANKGNILLHKAAQNAGIYGTGYLKIVPEPGILYQGEIYPRLVAMDPMWVTIETLPEDIETVTSYSIRYNIQDNDRSLAKKQVISQAPDSGWMITDYATDRMGRWNILYEQPWDYAFPPMLHWQNLPQPSDVYGQSDIEDIIELQDRVNFVASNISKIIRYHAHPKTWARGLGSQDKASWGADEMIVASGDQAMISNLEMQSDLASSRAFLMELRQSIFDISRTVDITSVADKLGSLTNFGLRVLFMDALAKLGTKRQLMGEALIDLNDRILTMGDMTHDDGGSVKWSDALPTNEQEETAAVQADMAMGILSKQTAASIRNYDYEQEKQLIAEEKQSEGNIGAALLAAFGKGQ
jgi:hypothetical protein